MARKRGRKRKNPREFTLVEEKRTVELPAKAVSLLEILRDPASVGLTTTEICRRAGINPSTYYRYFQNPDFIAVVKQECYGIVYSNLMKTLHVVTHHASDPSEKSHHWAKMVLGMGKMVDSEEKKSTPQQINFIINVERPQIEQNQPVQGEVIDV